MNFHRSTNFVRPVVSLLKQMSKKRSDVVVFEEPCETFLKSLMLELIIESIPKEGAYDFYMAESKNFGRRRSN